MDAPEIEAAGFEARPPFRPGPPVADRGREMASWADRERRFERPPPRPGALASFVLAAAAWMVGTVLAIVAAALVVWLVPGWPGALLGMGAATCLFSGAVLAAGGIVYGGRP